MLTSKNSNYMIKTKGNNMIFASNNQQQNQIQIV